MRASANRVPHYARNGHEQWRVEDIERRFHRGGRRARARGNRGGRAGRDPADRAYPPGQPADPAPPAGRTWTRTGSSSYLDALGRGLVPGIAEIGRGPHRPAADRATAMRGIHHAGIVVSDIHRAIDFYTGVLGLELMTELTPPDEGQHLERVLNLPGARLHGGAMLRAGAGAIELHEFEAPRGPADTGPRARHRRAARRVPVRRPGGGEGRDRGARRGLHDRHQPRRHRTVRGTEDRVPPGSRRHPDRVHRGRVLARRGPPGGSRPLLGGTRYGSARAGVPKPRFRHLARCRNRVSAGQAGKNGGRRRSRPWPRSPGGGRPGDS